jgi:hypothetical protein
MTARRLTEGRNTPEAGVRCLAFCGGNGIEEKWLDISGTGFGDWCGVMYILFRYPANTREHEHFQPSNLPSCLQRGIRE